MVSTGEGERLVTPILEMRNVMREFTQGKHTVRVLNSVSLQIREGELVGLVGPSGAGKSTLLHVAGLLDTPSLGEVLLKGKEASALGDSERAELRRDFIGFVYQFPYLLGDFSAVENIVIPQLIAGRNARASWERAAVLLERVGLSKRAQHRPSDLSGGEQQRVAVARALANGPSLILADEPTGNLDAKSAQDVFELLMSMAREFGSGVLVATHNLVFLRMFDRVIELFEGQVRDYGKA